MWYYKDQQQNIHGPLTSKEMDTLFKERKVNRHTKVKSKTDDDYYKLVRFARIYYRDWLSNRNDVEKEVGDLPKKIAKFRKGFWVKGRGGETELENFERVGKRERVVSSVQRPNFIFLNGIEEDCCEDEEMLHVRLRSRTFVR